MVGRDDVSETVSNQTTHSRPMQKMITMAESRSSSVIPMSRWVCDLCQVNILYSSRKRHLTSKKHQKAELYHPDVYLLSSQPSNVAQPSNVVHPPNVVRSPKPVPTEECVICATSKNKKLFVKCSQCVYRFCCDCVLQFRKNECPCCRKVNASFKYKASARLERYSQPERQPERQSACE